jgi:hypothetical protein
LSVKAARGTTVAIHFSNEARLLDMTNEAEVIAMVMPDGEGADGSGRMQRMATLLMRSADGQMSLRTVSTDSALGRKAMSTGCFRNGTPIVDPVTRQLLGYEMEMVPSPFAAFG